jgi:hypothetical protein
MSPGCAQVPSETYIAIPTRVSELLTDKVRRNSTFLANKQKSSFRGDVGLASKGLARLSQPRKAYTGLASLPHKACTGLASLANSGLASLANKGLASLTNKGLASLANKARKGLDRLTITNRVAQAS